MSKITRALFSVSDKSNLVDFVRHLVDIHKVEGISTGGTAKVLREAKISVREVSEYTGFPEMMGGRLKTLHPKIYGGILGRRGRDDKDLKDFDVEEIDLVVCNLYPFEQTIAKPDYTFAEAIENIDIGGPTMIRAAAKNHERVTIVVDPYDYARVVMEMADNHGSVSPMTRYDLFQKAMTHTAVYDAAIAQWAKKVRKERLYELTGRG